MKSNYKNYNIRMIFKMMQLILKFKRMLNNWNRYLNWNRISRNYQKNFKIQLKIKNKWN